MPAFIMRIPATTPYRNPDIALSETNHLPCGGIGPATGEAQPPEFDQIKVFLDLRNATECHTTAWLLLINGAMLNRLTSD
jgi:hypothetical protein